MRLSHPSDTAILRLTSLASSSTDFPPPSETGMNRSHRQEISTMVTRRLALIACGAVVFGLAVAPSGNASSLVVRTNHPTFSAPRSGSRT